MSLAAELPADIWSGLKDPSLLRTRCLVGKDWIAADSGATIAVDNPATGEVIAHVPDMGGAETRRAIEAADAVWGALKKMSALKRSQLLRAWHDLILANQDDLALIMTLEQGKPLAEAKGEIAISAAYVLWFAEEARRAYGDVIPSPHADRRLVVSKQPVGVVAAITPWNFPSSMITRKLAPAIAAGCPAVVKPASQTPLSALALGELGLRAGFPAGVLNVVTGNPQQIGGEMTGNALVRKFSFTGSTPIGKKLMADCAATMKKVSMELGGNAPFIVFDDADLDAAVEGAIASKFRNNGQTCVCANRMLVQAGVYDAFAQKLSRAIAALKIGNGTEAGVVLGPLIDDKAVDKVDGLVKDAANHGATVVSGGKRHPRGGRFYEPTVITGVSRDMRLFSEEIFGPVAPLYRFETEEEAVQMANDTEFGLAAYFYTRDVGRVWRMSEALEYGQVGANVGVMTTVEAPFGGVKESGLGREGSKYGLDEYLEVKYMCMGGL